MKQDILKILAGSAFIIAGLVGFAYFKDTQYLLSMGILLSGVLLGFGLMAWTHYFEKIQHFLGKVKIEFYYIVWPKGHETFKSFVVVIVFSIIFAGLIWGIDQQLGFLYNAVLID